MSWINLKDYTVIEQVIFAAGCAFWFVVYVITIRNIHKEKFCEIPVLTVCGNISWEFLKGFVFETDMGMLYQVAYKGWFFLDLYICYGAFMYGYKQMRNPLFKSKSKLILAFALISWLVFIYLFSKEGYDDVVGAFSAFLLNVVISAMYIPLIVESEDLKGFSYTVSWAKMLGTGLVGVFAAIHWPDNYLLLALGIIIFIMDFTYFIIFTEKRKRLLLS